MANEVVVTRKGQTTIPVEIRRKYKIEEGDILEVVDTGQGILLKRKVSLFDLAGGGSKVATVSEMKKWLDKLRDEDA